MKSKITILRPQDVWQPKLGAPRGNRNAFKTGMHTQEPRALRKEIAAWKRMTRILLAEFEATLSPPRSRQTIHVVKHLPG